MLRNFSKLRQPLNRAASSFRKQYGVAARVQVGDVQGDEASMRQERNEACKNVDNYETFPIYNLETPNKIQVNVEELDKEFQAVFAENYLKTVKKLVDENEITHITFNYLNEDVFRNKLNMPIRKLGYSSSFQRYNDDRGLAVFVTHGSQTTDADSRRIGAYHRMAYTKSRKTDIQNLVM